MPSPAIPRFNSDPFLSSSSSSKTRLPPSNRSACSSSRSNKSSYVNKLRSLIGIGRKTSHSDLTEESLEAHNRRQEAIILQTRHSVDDKNAKCSPYYNGLTDCSLIISRKKLHLPQSSSPGRESHATTTVSNSSSLPSFMLVKMHEWSSRFSSLNSSTKDRHKNAPAPAPAAATTTVKKGHACCPYSSSEPSAARMPLERKEPDKNVLSVIHEEKPLRARQSKSPSPPPPPPPPPSMTAEAGRTNNVDEKNETDAIEMLDRSKQFTWADKYRPKALKDFICNRTTATMLQGMIKDVDCNPFIFEGPAGVGKRTMAWAMLQQVFGPDRLQTMEESKAFKLKGESVGSIEVRIKAASRHVEVNLSDLKGYEKHVIVELIKETSNAMSKKGSQLKRDSCRAIILNNADKLSADAVLYMKWLLQRYKGSSKFFFCCSDVSKLQPIKELCTLVQFFLPSNKEIVEVLEYIAEQEGIKLPHQFAESIAINSKNNLRQAIRSLEASWKRSYPFTEDQKFLTGWEDDIANIAKNMVQEQSPKQLYIIRGKLQNLMGHDVSPEFICESLLEELKKNLDEFCQQQLDNLHRDYSLREKLLLQDGKGPQDPANQKFQKYVNIEEFIAKFMSLYKLHITSVKPDP
ncbi:hypothetical protein P3X46_009205 [Hevea brasiliensis]|uniref:AAA+ ATPase domain-containing protein n=1 Tax=Hevea brasiliensis TaxID=3981 RepID=A0ABQ9MPY4_HEVBR|nr:hypothetical protein P3X46_009205 [Hevea brasiliensis]